MKSKEFKMNLALMDALTKLAEVIVIFNEQTDLISEENGKDYTVEKDDFNRGMFICKRAVKGMLGESAMNAVCKSVPVKNRDNAKEHCGRRKTNIFALIDERIKKLYR